MVGPPEGAAPHPSEYPTPAAPEGNDDHVAGNGSGLSLPASFAQLAVTRFRVRSTWARCSSSWWCTFSRALRTLLSDEPPAPCDRTSPWRLGCPWGPQAHYRFGTPLRLDGRTAPGRVARTDCANLQTSPRLQPLRDALVQSRSALLSALEGVDEHRRS